LARKVERFGWTFARGGTKVMQIENDYGRGSLQQHRLRWRCRSLMQANLRPTSMVSAVIYGFGQEDSPRWCGFTAATIHKSQGSDFAPPPLSCTCFLLCH
jgi:hypothetical protein